MKNYQEAFSTTVMTTQKNRTRLKKRAAQVGMSLYELCDIVFKDWLLSQRKRRT